MPILNQHRTAQARRATAGAVDVLEEEVLPAVTIPGPVPVTLGPVTQVAAEVVENDPRPFPSRLHRQGRQVHTIQTT